MLKSAVALVLCVHGEISELLAHDEWREGGSFPIMKGILCVQGMGWNYRSRGNHDTVLLVTNDWRLQSWGKSSLGTYTSLDEVRKGNAYIKVGIIVAVINGVFLSNRQVDKRFWARVRGTEISYVRAVGVMDVSVDGSVSSKTTVSLTWCVVDMVWTDLSRVSCMFSSSNLRYRL